jgi:hypothetical protein
VRRPARAASTPHVKEGGLLTQRIAQGASGPHGKNYWKRISSEMTGPLSGEWGPTGVVDNNAVGGGWRHGPPNTDLEKSQDVIGPKFADEVGRTAASWFWPS